MNILKFDTLTLCRVVSGSMGQILKQIESFEEKLVSRCVKQILRALNYLHNKGTYS